MNYPFSYHIEYVVLKKKRKKQLTRKCCFQINEKFFTSNMYCLQEQFKGSNNFCINGC